jgi:DNA topoisomerase-2
MVGFNEHKKIYRYNHVSEVLEEFYNLRLRYYGLRKEYLLSRLKREL